MKPYVICHMVTSLDGRILTGRWRPEEPARRAVFEQLHERLAADAWLVGRVTGQEYAKRNAYPPTDQRYGRESWFARRDAAAYGIVLDPEGKIAWGCGDIGGDPIVVVLTEQVRDAHLAGLRDDKVSYIFAGERELDLARAIDTLEGDLGIRRLEVNGGGLTNAAFLRAGLIDEISVAIFPAVDGTSSGPAIFESGTHPDGTPVKLEAITLESSEVLDGGAVWLRYLVRATTT
jgi:riboflavin biosynthesis pyrimidine reductase